MNQLKLSVHTYSWCEGKNVEVSRNWFGFTSDRIKKWHIFFNAIFVWQLIMKNQLLFKTQAQVKPFYTAHLCRTNKVAVFKRHLSFSIFHYALRVIFWENQAEVKDGGWPNSSKLSPFNVCPKWKWMMVFSNSVVAFHSLTTGLLVLAITDPDITQNICRIWSAIKYILLHFWGLIDFLCCLPSKLLC